MKKYLLLSVSIVFFLVSCNQDIENKESRQNDATNSNNGKITVEQSSYEQNYQHSNNDIATHLANLASDVPDVNDAAAIIAGPYAVVGIDIHPETDRQQVGTIKYAVSESLKNDPYGKTAVVIADADVMQRFRDMNNKIQQGYPIQGIVEELAEIVGRYMPTFPVPENRPEEPSENEQRLRQHEDENKLKEIRKEQSNQEKPEQNN